MEPHGLIAHWEGDGLTVWEPSQWLDGMARDLCRVVRRTVRECAPGLTLYRRRLRLQGVRAMRYGAVAAIAAKMLGRPVKLAVTRPQTFTAYGGRAATRQTVALGATREGKIQSIVHRGVNETSIDGMWVEPLRLGHLDHVCDAELLARGRMSCGSIRWCRARCARRAKTRAPSASKAPSTNWPTRSASIRWRSGSGTMPNRTRRRKSRGRHGSCARPTRPAPRPSAGRSAAAEPRSMRDGNQLIGWGVAAGTYPVRRAWRGDGAHPRRRLGRGRKLGIDMGQGTYTILAQTAAEVLGVPAENVVGEARRFPLCPRRRHRRFAAGRRDDGRGAQGGAAALDQLVGLAHQRSEFAVPCAAGQHAGRCQWPHRLAARRRT